MNANDVRTYGKTVGFGSRFYAVLDVNGQTRTYREPTDIEISGAFTEAERLLAALPELPDGTSPVPDEACDPNGFRRMRNLVFGIDTFAKMFNTRQLFVLGRIAQAVRAAHDAMLAEGTNAGACSGCDYVSRLHGR